MSDSIIVRFPPSPTGKLHLGNLRVAIYNWLFAKSCNGKFLLRIEDTDTVRSKKEFEEDILKSLAWIGIKFDQDPVIQSSNIKKHLSLVDVLLKKGMAYKCYCSVQDLEKMRSESGKEGFVYTGKCRDALDGQGKDYTIRFFVDRKNKTFSYKDLVKKEIKIDADKIDDFVLLRQDGTPTYNLAVAHDDHEMKITHVIRGEDHIINTFKQILIYKAMNWSVPFFGHLPMILSSSGGKLSKRDCSVSVSDYIKKGFLPEGIINYLVRLGWSFKDQEIFSLDELISLFKIEDVNSSGATFDIKKFEWINSVHMKNLSYQKFLKLLEFADKSIFSQIDFNSKLAQNLYTLFFDRFNNIIDLAKQIIFVFQFLNSDGPKKEYKTLDEKSQDLLKNFFAFLSKNAKMDSLENIELQVKKFIEIYKVKFPELAKPFRAISIGCQTGPSIAKIIYLIDFKKLNLIHN